MRLMRDDFSALDFLSCGGFRLSPPKPPRKAKRKFTLPRPCRAKTADKRGLGSLLPFLASKVQPPTKPGLFEGWPVPLSWPRVESTSNDFWWEQADRQAS